MRFLVVAVGHARAGPERALWEAYSERLVTPTRLIEVESKRPGPGLKEREAELLLKSVPDDAVIVALDERGKSLTSENFAKTLAQWRDGGAATATFVIGGADGLAEGVRMRARLLLCLGAMTWPHLLVRGLLAEQLYRAERIWAGHPYHRA
ncbi:MAG: 23S rRNA (pseudouridine(1915)-N(3))-methyltransferase RlmH [Alphaproteobacteria bacterium]|nr:23S rRNA (pseudouridine(1915)-N(3))-methyltransferase RlmH [Alphaproteobacteria bacterium]